MEKSPTHLDALDRAIALLGGVTAMARRLPKIKNYQTIQQWRISGVPAEYCPDIERETNMAVTCEQLRDDVDWAVLRRTATEKRKAPRRASPGRRSTNGVS